MTEHAMRLSSKYDTETKPVAIGTAVLLVCIVFLLTISGTGVADMLGYARKIDARVPTFLLRMFFLLVALAAAFIIFTNTSTYKRKRVAYGALAVPVRRPGIFFLIYVIIPIFPVDLLLVDSAGTAFTTSPARGPASGSGWTTTVILLGRSEFLPHHWSTTCCGWLLFMLAVPIGLGIALFPQPDRSRHPHLQVAVLLSHS